MTKYLICVLAFCLLIRCTNDNKTPVPDHTVPSAAKETPAINYSLLKTFPHDTNSYTQGLLFHEGKLFESTGSPMNQLQTKSVFGILDTTTGKMDIKAELDRTIYFGEGIVILDKKLFQLTWQNQVGFIYDAKTFKPLGQFNIPSREGWGLTTDGTSLIMSDGTNKLMYVDPLGFRVTRTIQVTRNGYAEDYLNELEFIKGSIYANVYQKNYIVKIDTANGKVTGQLDLSALVEKAKQKSPGAEVLNGIAFDSISDKILVTGKLWPDMYQIDFPIERNKFGHGLGLEVSIIA